MNGARSKYEGRDMYRFWWANLRESDYLYDVGANGSIIIKWFFKEWGLRRGLKLCASDKDKCCVLFLVTREIRFI